MLTPEKYSQLHSELLSIVEKQIEVTTGAGLAENPVAKALDEASGQLADNSLRVLVMGKFSSGKSTFLNALMGRKLLPAKPKPTTAVIGEITYSDEPAVTLVTKQGENIEISVDDLKNYIVIDHSDESDRVEADEIPYSKVLIRYPLPVCKDGILLVDSPGLDDPTCHDAITQDYLPQADAIIYCMNVNQAFNASDRIEIERLRALGYTSIIFVLTYYDVLLYNDMMNGENEAEETRRHYINVLKEYTDLGESGIFFIGSLPALKAKTTGRDDLLPATNFPILEKRLEEILFNERGRMKLLKALFAGRRANRSTATQIHDLSDLANTNRAELAQRIVAAEKDLSRVQTRAEQITSQIGIDSANIIHTVKDMAEGFVLEEVLPNVDKWTAEFEPGEGQSISFLHPKRSAKAFTEACLAFVQKRIEARAAQWCETSLVKGYVMPQIELLCRRQDANVAAYERELGNLRASLNFGIDSDAIQEQENGTNSSRILAALAGAFFSPDCIAVGGAFGWRGLLTSVITATVGAIVLGIISLFTPVGWVGLIITWVLSAITSGAIRGASIAKNIKSKVAKEIAAGIQTNQRTLVGDIVKSVEAVLAKVQTAISENLNEPVQKYKVILDKARETVGAQESTIKADLAKYAQLRSDNSGLADRMDAFSQSLNA